MWSPRLILRLNTLLDVVATQQLVSESCLAQPSSKKIGALSHTVRKDASPHSLTDLGEIRYRTSNNAVEKLRVSRKSAHHKRKTNFKVQIKMFSAFLFSLLLSI